ncbi:iron ABC transporter [Pseudidiomarina aestuarii]|uniref:Iron ABC transporter n=1 Tax=Pseudidiomarina aestuarii TaxID=624146 RepID=A0A7Z6ZRN1_9GAMM|nr:ABC transporter ATP-binding protein [Pseudidiomarina aestuarii]RUO37911.1 iron ABC transporter [Pseudidiomarina aestuarii]
MLSVDQITVAQRLDPVSFTAAEGEVIGIIGPNGAGKSSLLEVLVGSVLPQSGQVLWGGENIIGARPMRRRHLVSYIPQQPSVFADITVTELLYEATVNLGWSSVQQHDKIAQVLREFDLQPFASRSILRLSGGEQRRVHCACSLLNQGALVIADEPTAGLDLYHQLMLLELLVKRARAGALVMIALHDLSHASMFCDRLALLDRGQFIQIGTPNEVLTATNLEKIYRVQVDWFCDERGVAMRPHRIIDTP